MKREFDRCALCGDYLSDPHQKAEFMTKAGTEDAHKSCLYQLMMDSWEEQIYRNKRGIDINAAYVPKNIANPAVRKALQLDVDPEQRLAQDYAEHGATDALQNMVDNDSDGLTELINRALKRG